MAQPQPIHQRRAKKPARYPKKFRQKLERVADRRDRRLRDELDPPSAIAPAFCTLTHELLRPETVHLALMRFTEFNHWPRVEGDYSLSSRETAYTVGPAPWTE